MKSTYEVENYQEHQVYPCIFSIIHLVLFSSGTKVTNLLLKEHFFFENIYDLE